MQVKDNFLCRDSIQAAPLVLDLVRFMDVARHADMVGILVSRSGGIMTTMAMTTARRSVL